MKDACFIELIILYIMQIFNIHKQAEFEKKQWTYQPLLFIEKSGHGPS